MPHRGTYPLSILSCLRERQTVRKPQPLNQPDKTRTRKNDDPGSSSFTYLLHRKEHGETTGVDVHHPPRVDAQRVVALLGKLTQVHAEPGNDLVLDELRQNLRSKGSLGLAGAVHPATLAASR